LFLRSDLGNGNRLGKVEREREENVYYYRRCLPTWRTRAATDVADTIDEIENEKKKSLRSITCRFRVTISTLANNINNASYNYSSSHLLTTTYTYKSQQQQHATRPSHRSGTPKTEMKGPRTHLIIGDQLSNDLQKLGYLRKTKGER
jgi:hypothetical protein